MTRKFILLVLALSACGPASLGQYECPDIKDWSFDIYPDCSKVQSNINLAEQMLGVKLPSIPVYVSSAAYFEEGDTGSAQGHYHPNTGISLDCTGQHYLHERIHQREYIDGIGFNYKHEGWDSKGYNALDIEFFHAAARLRCPK